MAETSQEGQERCHGLLSGTFWMSFKNTIKLLHISFILQKTI